MEQKSVMLFQLKKIKDSVLNCENPRHRKMLQNLESRCQPLIAKNELRTLCLNSISNWLKCPKPYHSTVKLSYVHVKKAFFCKRWIFVNCNSKMAFLDENIIKKHLKAEQSSKLTQQNINHATHNFSEPRVASISSSF